MNIFEYKGCPAESEIPEDDEFVHFYSPHTTYCMDFHSGALIRMTAVLSEVTCPMCRATEVEYQTLNKGK